MSNYAESATSLDDAVEALDYWRSRRRRLAWHRRRARREAEQMVDRWERRVRAAVLGDPALPLEQRLAAGWAALRARAGITGRRVRHGLALAALTLATAAGAGFAAVIALI